MKDHEEIYLPHFQPFRKFKDTKGVTNIIINHQIKTVNKKIADILKISKKLVTT